MRMTLKELAALRAKGKSVDDIAGMVNIPKQPKVVKPRKKPEPSAHCFICGVLKDCRLICLGDNTHVCSKCEEDVRA